MPLDQHRRKPRQLHRARVVRHPCPALEHGAKRTAQRLEAEHLGREGAPEVFTGQCRGDPAIDTGPLHRVVDRPRQQAAALAGVYRHQAVQVLPAQAGARGVVHQHPVLGGRDRGEVIERVEHRVAALRPAFDTANPRVPGVGGGLPPAVAGGEGQHHPFDGGVIEKGVEGVIDDGAAAQRQVLLGHRRPHAAADAGGRHDRPVAGVTHSAPWRARPPGRRSPPP